MYARYLIFLLCCYQSPLVAGERFSGNATAAPVASPTSARERFSIHAAFTPTAPAIEKSADGRFSLNAGIRAPNALLGSCGAVSDDIFRNGFE
jgi:hypothetical protein